MPKIDGLAVSLIYENSKLISAATRGNGTVGQSVIDNIKEIESIPNTIDDFSGELRGEIIMKKLTFSVIKEEMIMNGEKAPANPRNMASGTLLQKDPKETAKKALHFVCYECITDNQEFETEVSKFDYVYKNLKGIRYVEMSCHEYSNESEMINEINKWEERRESLEYCIDGLVFSANDNEIINDLGYKGKCPVGKVAFKFRPQQTTSIIEDITWQLGRTGRLTPVAKITPVELDGSIIDSPTLHNYAQIQKKGVCIGSTVIIEKAGDIIPQIVRVVKKGTGDINIPAHCTSGLEDVVLDEKEVSLWCVNPLCPGKIEFRINHFLKTLEVKDVGLATIRAMLDNNIISDIPDLYNIDFTKLSSLSGFGKKSARKVIEEIEDKRKIELSTFLDSLGISGLGTTTSKVIATEFKTLARVLSVDPDKFSNLEGIGDLTAKSIHDGLVLYGGIIDSLILAGLIIKDVKVITGSLTGKTFCVTGKLSVGRKEMATLIEESGGIIKSSVGKGLDYLVAGENVGAGKTTKAEKYGTNIINEDEIRAML
ncbi:MAG: NAD-dependent DNA ligase LigA, partial [Candidatus Heimdallarchaeaceae archaeon]